MIHPDHQPVERHAQAHRVTAELNRLRPFTPPNRKPKPTAPLAEQPSQAPGLLQEAIERLRQSVCETCVTTVPIYYCDACKKRWNENRRNKRERENEKQRRSGGPGKGKRRDARFCSDACRQRAQRERVTATQTRTSVQSNSHNANARPCNIEGRS
jgi:hypothetical protein